MEEKFTEFHISLLQMNHYILDFTLLLCLQLELYKPNLSDYVRMYGLTYWCVIFITNPI